MRDAYKPTLADEVVSSRRFAVGLSEWAERNGHTAQMSVDTMVNGINAASKYNVSNVVDMAVDYFKKNPLVEAIAGEMGEGLNMPHPVVWMEAGGANGLVAFDEERGVHLMFVSHETDDTMAILGHATIDKKSKRIGFFHPRKLCYINGPTYDLTKNLAKSELIMQDMLEQVKAMVGMFLYAIKLLNCKNITTVTREGPATINERRKREGKPPYTSYKVLKLPVGDQTRVVNGNQNADKNEGLTRLHICRGHFKTYTEDKPLMGRHTGTYWWPQMLKGKKENGQVIKDYELTVAS